MQRLLHLLVAEIRNANGTSAAMGALPVATWQATIDPSTFRVRSFVPAADRGADLYGWAVASDSRFTYLYMHCYRQFVPGASWDMRNVAYRHPWIYRPAFMRGGVGSRNAPC